MRYDVREREKGGGGERAESLIEKGGGAGMTQELCSDFFFSLAIGSVAADGRGMGQLRTALFGNCSGNTGWWRLLGWDRASKREGEREREESKSKSKRIDRVHRILSSVDHTEHTLTRFCLSVCHFVFAAIVLSLFCSLSLTD